MTPEQISEGGRRIYERTLANRYVRPWAALRDWQRAPFEDAFVAAASYVAELAPDTRPPARVVKAVASPVLTGPLMERWHQRSRELAERREPETA